MLNKLRLSTIKTSKAKETIEILKTPLDKSDELRDKYLNEERKE